MITVTAGDDYYGNCGTVLVPFAPIIGASFFTGDEIISAVCSSPCPSVSKTLLH